MSSGFLADNRVLIAEDSSGNIYIVINMEVSEKLSEPFLVKATVLVNDDSSSDLLGTFLTLSYRPGFETDRRTRFIINGSVIGIRVCTKVSGNIVYEMELRPWLSLLGLRKNCRIFQNSDIRTIIEQVCTDYDFDTKIQFMDCDDLELRVFCVQYQESDFEFICRLLSEEGKYYYFTHANGQHTMIVGSDTRSFTEFDEGGVEYGEKATDQIKSLSQWNLDLDTSYGGEATVTGFSREQALIVSSSLANRDTGVIANSGSTLWDSRIDTQSQADKAALNFVNREYRNQAFCSSSLPGLRSGTKFELACHPDAAQQGAYYIDQVTHQFNSVITKKSENRQREYLNTFTCIKADCPFVPPRLRKPEMNGIQTATVSGPDGQEVFYNDNGYVKVRFHWDTSEVAGDQCSCWVPVAQPLAGSGFGACVLPRVGQEVIISFIDGDPDQPIVMGSLYNGLQKVPYEAGNLTGFKTLSIPDGVAGHEVRLNDTKDGEEFYIRSQKDMLLEVANDMVSSVVGNQTMNVEKDVNIKGQNISIEGSAGITLTSGDSTITIDPAGVSIKAAQVTIESDVKTEITGTMVNIEGTLTGISGEMIDVTGKLVTASGEVCLSLGSDGVCIINGMLTMVN